MAINEIIREFVPGSGQFVILPKGVSLLNQILALIGTHIAQPIGFEEVYVPKIIPVSTLVKAGIIMDRHNGKWNEYLESVTPFSATKGVKEEYIIDPLQCLAIYQALEDETLDVTDKPLRWYDHSGPTYRNEDLQNILAGIKQREFHRAEFVFIGNPQQVEETRSQCLAQMEKLCQVIGFEYRIVKGESCYQEGGDVKDIEVLDPKYNGWIELAGAAKLYDILTKRRIREEETLQGFNIQSIDGNKLWSGCMGIGLNRFLHLVVQNEKYDHLQV